ncbi:MAG: fumarylacetoacetate hydrolase family protein [Bifidobacteriaceae bacterium]|jgi:2-keto-4-pentenoate hydratase/2-oxohepta-3-ene-1,7-dioic acid hydratase in catechol pathway|nr:fumarylacetoacetate hydrolase family protein [Bifidobacteriaceae bacterium]
MRIARYTVNDEVSYGIVEGEEGSETIHAIEGDPLYTEVRPTGKQVALEEVRLLAPVIPRSKVVGVGRNYAAHVREMGGELPSEPLIFLKPNTAVIGPGDPFVLPAYSRRVEHEAELAVVISRICKQVPVRRAGEASLGYTVANDVTARDIQAAEDQWTRAKGFDTSCPLGPWIETELDLSNAPVRAWVDGELRQDGTTADLLFGVAELIAYISETFTLLPGDVILTGTPAGVGPIEPGNRVTCEVGGIGTLSNPALRRD